MRYPLATLVVLLAGFPAYAQPDPKTPSPAKYEVRATRGHKAPMRDGVKLSVDIYRPAAEGKYPAILIHTPYNNNPTAWTDRARAFAKRGYLVAVSDCRGRFDSEGDWDPFGPKHKHDGHDLIEWLARLPGCDGNVGMMGQSYMGWTQWWTATQAPPSLKAIVPEVAPPDPLFNGPYQNGILVCWMMDWAASQAGRTTQSVGPGGYGGFVAGRDKDYRELPYSKLCERRGALDAPWFDTWIRDNLSTSPYWRGIAYQTPESYSRVRVPSLNVTGWFDANYPGSPMNYTAMKQHGATPEARRPRLVIGPWMHSWNTTRTLSGIDFGPQAMIDWDGYVARWFDRYLKGVQNGVEDDPPVQVFVMGRNAWRAEQDWPLPQTQWTKYYLHSKGKANSLTGDGALSVTPPKDEPADTYTHDPGDPVPDAFTNGHIDGPIDTSKSAQRNDVLVYSTPPLTEDVEVVGPLTATLYAATSAKDTDWMVRLVDVYPDGRSALLCDAVLRARCRDPEKRGAFNAAKLSALKPEEVYEYSLEFWRGTGNVFLKGHRIRIEISSTFFPYYLPNPGTGEDNVGLQTRKVVAKQRILHDAAHPSHVVLPIIPARLERIRASDDKTHFVGATSGKRFVVWGVNYDHDDAGRLLEDYWTQEWRTVVEDFKEIKALGANVVRVHLQTAKFMDTADKPNEANLARLTKLVQLAEETGLYLDVTGLGCYHKKDVPAWYDKLDEAARWDVQARFWQAVAGACKGSDAIFCYDLMNEPVLAGDKNSNDWLAGEPLGGKHFVQRITRDLAGRSREEVAKQWILKLTTAIRKVDDRHLLTVGVIPWAHVFKGAKPLFYAPGVGDPLDFVSVHLYPKKGEVDAALTALKVYEIGKPLVVEEIFPLGCSIEEVGAFIDGSRKFCDGWVSFYWGKTIAENEKAGDIKGALIAKWLSYFRDKGRAVKVTP